MLTVTNHSNNITVSKWFCCHGKLFESLHLIIIWSTIHGSNHLCYMWSSGPLFVSLNDCLSVPHNQLLLPPHTASVFWTVMDPPWPWPGNAPNTRAALRSHLTTWTSARQNRLFGRRLARVRLSTGSSRYALQEYISCVFKTRTLNMKIIFTDGIKMYSKCILLLCVSRIGHRWRIWPVAFSMSSRFRLLTWPELACHLSRAKLLPVKPGQWLSLVSSPSTPLYYRLNINTVIELK